MTELTTIEVNGELSSNWRIVPNWRIVSCANPLSEFLHEPTSKALHNLYNITSHQKMHEMLPLCTDTPNYTQHCAYLRA